MASLIPMIGNFCDRIRALPKPDKKKRGRYCLQCVLKDLTKKNLKIMATQNLDPEAIKTVGDDIENQD